jgi:hypothetical protein
MSGVISECGLCKRVFTSLSGFDAHQERRFGEDPPIICRDPETVGLVLDDRGRWQFPATERSRARLAEMRAGTDRG